MVLGYLCQGGSRVFEFDPLTVCLELQSIALEM